MKEKDAAIKIAEQEKLSSVFQERKLETGKWKEYDVVIEKPKYREKERRKKNKYG